MAALRTQDRRLAVAEALSRSGSLSSADMARLAGEYGVSHTTISNDRKLILREREATYSNVQILNHDDAPIAMRIVDMTHEERLQYVLSEMSRDLEVSMPGSPVRVGAAKMVIDVSEKLQALQPADEGKHDGKSPAQLEAEFQKVFKRLPRRMQKKLREG